MPQMVIHGINDPTVPFTQGEMVRDMWRSLNGCSDQTQPYDPDPCVVYSDCTSGFPVVWCAHDGGHDTPKVAGLEDAVNQFLMSL